MAIYTKATGATKHPIEMHEPLANILINSSGVVGENDLKVNKRAAAGMGVQIGIGRAWLVKGDNSIAYPVKISMPVNDASTDIATNGTGNPRIDTVVLFYDEGEASPDEKATNVAKIKIVQGVASPIPTVPDETQIISAIGGAYPFTKLANVNVASGANSIVDANIQDVRVKNGNKLQDNIDTIDPQLNGGWWNAGITATFSASANGVNKINVSQDLRNKLAVGNWFSLTQNNARRYYLISLVTDNRIEGVGPDNLTNQPITDLKFSREYQPAGAWVRANVKAAMYRDGDQNLTSGQNNTFQLNKVQYDPMNICNTGAHTMIIPVTGFYLVSAGIRATSTDNISQLDLNVSGTVLNRRNCITNAKTTFDDVTVARECQLNKGTIIKCEGWYAGSGETKLQGGHPFSYLSVKFLSV